MKALFTSLSAFFFIGLVACKKVENKVIFEGGTTPQLTSSTSQVTLEPGQESNLAIRFNWTAPNYKLNTGVSPHDVTYTLEIDTLGVNFSNPKRYIGIISKDFTVSFTVSELNSIFGNTMLLPVGLTIPRRTYTFQARLTSSINGAVKLTSNVISFTARPFAPPPKVEIPTAGTLWATGDAFASSWQNPLTSPYNTTQKFTQKSLTDYELIVNMPGGGGYKLIQTQGDWDSQYHMISGGTWQGGEFEKKNADPTFPGPPTSGTYKISVNFQLGVFNVTKQ